MRGAKTSAFKVMPHAALVVDVCHARDFPKMQVRFASPCNVGGGPTLVRNGAVVPDGKDTVRHPRAAFGFNKDYYFFVVADGRRTGVSVGMSFAELAREMKFWGCEQAINLDGGGSAMLWVGGQILSQPSEDSRERPCANALVAVRRNIKPAKTK